MMYYVLIVDLHNQEHVLETDQWNEVLSFVKMYKGKIKTFIFKNKQEVVMKFNYQNNIKNGMQLTKIE